MDVPARAPDEPEWCQDATRGTAFLHGLRAAPSTPVFVVVATYIGFAALARDVGLDLFQTLFISVTMFALPGQVVLADQIGVGASLAAAMFAVTLTAVRLLPLTVSLMPYLRGEKSRLWLAALLAHFVSITTWLESMRRLPPLPARLRPAFYLGFSLGLFAAVICATVLGHVAAGQVHPALAAGLIFVSPLYFYLSLIGSADTRTDLAAMLIGTIMGPVLFMALPGLDLLLTGLVGGSIAYGVFRWRKSRI